MRRSLREIGPCDLSKLSPDHRCPGLQDAGGDWALPFRGSSCRRAAALADRIYSSFANANPISRLGTIPNNRSGILEKKKAKKRFGKTKNRRFLYMVDFRAVDPSFQRLRRIDPSSLFYADPAAAAAAAAVEDVRLSPADMNFFPPR
ncbi:Os02g0143600 [Oryza sativa Japonica Group]|jgi:hypothetical protein|uniref:Os02g0143600 protein n=2 Tax=Oryza sativa subsp. japonica TaxID=39947 RepID=Q6YXW1_ORYSJ|nr:hypothetical protein [Oryza sativa Japonica Group]BAS76947.1 Os02g0143600 [Oryza sativa Japonica Group]